MPEKRRGARSPKPTEVSPAGAEAPLDEDLPENQWELSEALIKRLRRVEGQARGLQKMLAEGRECEEIIIQLAAMREAINKVGMALIGRYMEKCMRQDIAQGNSGREGLERAVNILMKFS